MVITYCNRIFQLTDQERQVTFHIPPQHPRQQPCLYMRQQPNRYGLL